MELKLHWIYRHVVSFPLGRWKPHFTGEAPACSGALTMERWSQDLSLGLLTLSHLRDTAISQPLLKKWNPIFR